MANVTGGNPLYGDTAAALTTKQVRIQAIAWISDETAGKDIAADDDFLLSDANGYRIFGKRAEFAGDDAYVTFPNGYNANGITVTTLDGGYFYVYLV